MVQTPFSGNCPKKAVCLPRKPLSQYSYETWLYSVFPVVPQTHHFSVASVASLADAGLAAATGLSLPKIHCCSVSCCVYIWGLEPSRGRRLSKHHRKSGDRRQMIDHPPSSDNRSTNQAIVAHFIGVSDV